MSDHDREGLVHIYTGDGKGKTTASVGLAVRSAGAGHAVMFIQYVKGGAESAELSALRRLGVEVVRPGRASSGLMGGGITDEDRAAADAAVAATRAALDGTYDLVVLDEACVAAAAGLIDVEELIGMVSTRPSHVEVVMTGRGAPEALLDIADYVSEICAVRHPFERGVASREGIEF